MPLYECPSCQSCETLEMVPDCCSHCGGSLSRVEAKPAPEKRFHELTEDQEKQARTMFEPDEDCRFFAYVIGDNGAVVSRVPLNSFEQKQEERRVRYEGRAEAAEGHSQSRFNAARKQLAGIPPGQPILVGHHSEARHRRDLSRHDSHMRAGIDAQGKANHYHDKAASVGKGGISADDADAMDKLTTKLAKRVERQESYRRTNKVWRMVQKNPDSPATARALDALTDAERRLVTTYKAQYSWEKGPAQDYQLSNNSAEIRRLKKRIEALQRAENRVAADPVPGDGFVIIENTDENRIQIIFDGKPEKAVRVILKNHRFRWAPSSGAWQRQLNNAGIHAAQQVKRQLEDTGAQ